MPRWGAVLHSGLDSHGTYNRVVVCVFVFLLENFKMWFKSRLNFSIALTLALSSLLPVCFSPANAGFNPEPDKDPLARASRSRAPVVSAAAAEIITLNNGTGDGTVSITVDGYGSFGSSTPAGNAFYDPVGATESQGTVYESAVYFSPLQGFLSTDALGDGTSLAPISMESPDSKTAISQFDTNGFHIKLTQKLNTATSKGSTFVQTYAITNNTGFNQTISLVRHVDGDLLFSGGADNDFGGVSADDNILYEFDSGDDPSNPTTYVGIASSGGSGAGFTIQPYQFTDNIRSATGIPVDLKNQVFGDANGDDVTDSTYDITLSQQNSLTIPNGRTVTYKTSTIFGEGSIIDQTTEEGEITVSARKDTSDPNAVLATCKITPPAGETIIRYAWTGFETSTTYTKGSSRVKAFPTKIYTPACKAQFSNGQWSPLTTKLIHQVVHQTLDIAPTVVDLAVTEIKIPLDADHDALPDSWENYGVKRYRDSAGHLSYKKDSSYTLLANLPLNKMGSDALCKDIFVEVDSMTDIPADEIGHHHFLKASAMEKVRLAFFNAPVNNPQACGHNGIHLHIDHGSTAIMYVNPQNPDEKTLWGVRYSRATVLAHDEFISDTSEHVERDFNAIYKDNHFPIERRGVFHYAVSGHFLSEDSKSSGVSLGSADPDTSMSASDFVVTLGGFDDKTGTEIQQAGTFMHELGHNLGLYHGGFHIEGGGVTGDHTGFKPSHFSVMNYRFQLPGLSYYYNKLGVPVTDPTNGLMDYSRVTIRNDLNESSLSEPNGVQIDSALSSIGLPTGFTKYAVSYSCKPLFTRKEKFSMVDQAIDWNCDGDLIDENLVVDINTFKGQENIPEQLLQAPLSEWDRLVYTGSDVKARAIGGAFDNSTTLAQQAKSVLLANNSKLEEVDIDTLRSMPAIHAVQVSGKAMLKVNVGRNYDLTYRIKNTGIRADSYKLETSSQANWQILPPIQQEISLEPNQSTLLHVIVSVPSHLTDSAVKEVVTLRAISTTNENISDSVETRLQLE